MQLVGRPVQARRTVVFALMARDCGPTNYSTSITSTPRPIVVCEWL